MLKPLVVAAAALAIAGSSVVYAQHLGGPDRDDSHFAHRHRLSPEDRAAFVDARIAALKAGLELTPDQAKNWPDFEKALRDMAQVRAERMAAREAAMQNPDKARAAPFDRLAQRADGMAKASAALKHIAETGKPLYTSLDDAQKARFKKLAWLLRPHHHWHGQDQDGQGDHRWREGSDEDGPAWGHSRQFGQDEHQMPGVHRMMDEESESEL
jgi:zinc resistance-associated protein